MARHQKIIPRYRILANQASWTLPELLGNTHICPTLSESESVERSKSESVNELIFQFTDCLKTYNLKKLADLLSDTGKFYILNVLGLEIQVCKYQYLYWLQSKLFYFGIDTIEYGEKIGNLTGFLFVVYNEGTFPWQEPQHSETPIAGLMFEVENGKISVIDYVSDLVNISKGTANW